MRVSYTGNLTHTGETQRPIQADVSKDKQKLKVKEELQGVEQYDNKPQAILTKMLDFFTVREIDNSPCK